MDDTERYIQQEAAYKLGQTSYMQQSNSELNSLLAELTDPEQELEELELSLKGQKIEKGKAITVTEPLLNNKGVANMLRFTKSMVSKVMYMSNLEEDQIRIMTIELGMEIIVDLVMHRLDYEIKDFSKMSTIRTLVTYKAFEAGMSSLENGHRKFLKNSLIETTIHTEGQMSGKKGALSSLLNLGRK